MKIQRDIQIDAIKKRELFKVTKYEGYALITDGIYGVYVNDEEKWWIWNKTIKKFGKKAQYEIKRKIIEKKGKQEESVIVVVRNEETYDIVGIIPIIRNIEEMKNETYQL